MKNSYIAVNNISEKTTPEQSFAVQFITDWQDGKKIFEFNTSGSTGQPKVVHLKRELMAYSAQQTIDYLRLTKGGNLLLCLSPTFIAGSMAIVRALINQMSITIVPATKEIPELPVTFDLASMVPLQIIHLLNHTPERLGQFKNILIGGAPLSDSDEKRLLELRLDTRFFVTYGMTETVSHVAIRPIGTDTFTAVGDAHFSITDTGTLQIKGTITENTWLKTNDIVELLDAHHFRWIGRSDWVINSGGFKVHPEQVERKIAEQMGDQSFFIAGIPHPELGQQVVLLLEGNAITTYDFSELHPYEKPRRIVSLVQFQRTPTGKINRKATLDNFLKG